MAEADVVKMQHG